MMEKKEFLSTHAVYCKLLQPAYERMIVQHVYKNNINLKSGATGQLLRKRPKTTGFLAKRYENSSYPANSTYWNPTISEQWQVLQPSGEVSPAPSVRSALQERRVSYPQLTDEFNMRASVRANTFSATTRVREVPVSTIYRKEIQQFRSRTPSARGVRATALTGRSVFSHTANNVGGRVMFARNRTLHKTPCIVHRHQFPSPKTTCRAPWRKTPHSRFTEMFTGTAMSTCEAVAVPGKPPKREQTRRLEKEAEKKHQTRERKRLAQISPHRIDRMYYMHGSSTKIHSKYAVSDDELQRLRQLAITKSIYPPPVLSNPHSTPRYHGNASSTPDADDGGSAKTLRLPTAGDAAGSVGGSACSVEEMEEEGEVEEGAMRDREQQAADRDIEEALAEAEEMMRAEESKRDAEELDGGEEERGVDEATIQEKRDPEIQQVHIEMQMEEEQEEEQEEEEQEEEERRAEQVDPGMMRGARKTHSAMTRKSVTFLTEDDDDGGDDVK